MNDELGVAEVAIAAQALAPRDALSFHNYKSTGVVILTFIFRRSSFQCFGVRRSLVLVPIMPADFSRVR